MTLVYQVINHGHGAVVCPTMEDAIDLIESMESWPVTTTIRVWREDWFWDIKYADMQYDDPEQYVD